MEEIDVNKIIDAEKKIAEKTKSGDLKSGMLHVSGALLIVFAALLSYVSIGDLTAGFDIWTAAFSSVATFICVYAYSGVQSLRGQELGYKSKEFLEAKTRYDGLKKSFSEDGMVLALDDFCLFAAEKSLECRRRAILRPYGINYAAYTGEYCKMTRKQVNKHAYLTEEQRKAVIAANKLKMRTIPKSDLLKYSYAPGKSDYDVSASGREEYRKRRIKKFFFKFFVSAFSVTFGLQLVFHFTVEGLVRTVIQLMLVVVFGVQDYAWGYKNINETETAHLDSQSIVLEQAKKWIERRPKEPLPAVDQTLPDLEIAK